MRTTDETMKRVCIAARRSGAVVLTAVVALTLVAGLLLLVRLQARAQAGPEAVEAALSLEKRGNAEVAAPGDTLTYTIRIERDQPEVQLWMTDTLPSGLTLVADSLALSGKGAYGSAGNVITWTSANFGSGNFAVITFAAGISSEMEGEVVNTAEVTGTGELITDAWSTTVVSGLLHSQIHSPNKNAYITEKESLTVKGIAWREGADVPYLTEDTTLRLDKVNEWSYWARWTEVASAASYILQESTDPNFGTLTDNWPVVGTSKLMAKTSAEEGTYYYRVQAIHASVDVTPTRWSNVVAVTVPWEGAMSAAASAVTAEGAADSAATVEVRTGAPDTIADSAWHTADVIETTWGGWTWSYEWPLPESESTQYLIQSRASEDGESFGPPDTITVTLDNANYVVYLPMMARRWPPVPYGPTLNQIDNSNKWVNYRVSWSYSDANPDVPDPSTYTLQEARNPSFDNPTTYDPDGDTFYDVTDTGREKTGGTYYYRVRGHNAYGPGEWSNVVSTQIRVLPYAPTGLWVDDSNQDGDLTVNWSYGYDYPPATSYTLRETLDGDSTDYPVGGTSKELGDREDGTCYKVRANNDYGSGGWSNTVCIVVETGLEDDFDDPDSGWEVRRTSAPDIDDDTDLDYEDGRLITKSEDNWDFALFSPMVEAPSMPYRITMKTRLVEGVDAPGYGIVFRGNEGDFCRVERDDADDDDGCFYRYFRLNVTIDPGNHIRYEVKRIEYHDERGRARGKDLSDGYHDVDTVADWEGWNTWRIDVYEDYFRIYVNDHYLDTFYDDDYAGNRHFGILTSAYEYSPSVFEHEYFYVERIN